MSKSVTQLNPKAKKQQKKSMNNLKVLIGVQFLLTIGVIIFGIVTIFNTNLLYGFEILLGTTKVPLAIIWLIFRPKCLQLLGLSVI